MTTLGKYCHDFPRLAKESGYCFELHRGRVNWAEIETLNIDDIVSNRNFQLLEKNLINVINCNLEREYDVKILDQNFVKLFQLAQLGVDYLSYCELYLDRCIILLQEQLTSYQEECELLREENQRKTEQLKESKRKAKSENFYQCKKCEKIFLTETYLQSHEKRRHSNISQNHKICESKLVNKFQQTEECKSTFTASTQTTFETENIKENVKENIKETEISFLKKEHELKMGSLEKELNDLKERLQSTERKLTEKNEEISRSHQCPFPPNPVFYPQVFPFISPYVSQPLSVPCGSARNAESSLPPFPQQTFQKPEEKTPMLEKQLQVDERSYPELAIKSSNMMNKEILENKDSLLEKPVKPKIIRARKKLQYDKENLDPKLQIPEEEIKPVPFPRKPKTSFKHTEKEDLMTSVVPFIPDKSEAEEKSPAIEEKILTSTPIQEREAKQKSFFKKMVAKNSPKIQELSKNLKRSLTNLYDSVSSNSKDQLKAKDTNSEEVKSNVVEGLNSRLKELGIDPEWAGIPKETMKKKLKTLEHRRNLLARENSTYPSVRKRLEKTILKKMNKSSFFSHGKRATSIESLYEDSPKSLESPSPSISLDEQNIIEIKKEKERETEMESIKNQSPKMYDLDFDSESDNSDAVTPVQLNKEAKTFSSNQNFPETIENDIEEIKLDRDIAKPVVKDMDFSIFQIGKAKNNLKEEKEANPPKSVLLNSVNELQTDSDFDDDFLKEFEETSFKSIKGFLNSTKNDEKIKDDQTNEKVENQSILKNSQLNQNKSQSSVKKKVLFADYPVTQSQNNIAPFNAIGTTLDVKSNKKNDTWSSDSDWDQ